MMDTFSLDTLSFGGIDFPVYEDLTRYPGCAIFSSFGLCSFGLAALTIAIALGCSYLIDRKSHWIEEQVNKYLFAAFLLVWSWGFIIYNIGLYTGEPWSIFGNVPIAVLYAFGMFIFESDVSAIHQPFFNNGWFMLGFSTVHFFAAVISLAFVLKHFGFNVISALKRSFARSAKKNTYIFWGMNDATYYLAKDINNRFAGTRDYRIVVVRTTNDNNETAIEKTGVERLFDFFSMKNRDLERLKELNCYTLRTPKNLATIDNKLNDGATALNILQKQPRQKFLCKIISRMTTDTIHLFFLSNNEEANIRAVANLRIDSTIQTFAKKGKVKLYCHARFNSVHRVIEDDRFSENIEVKVVDSSHISVELLKQKGDLQPVSFVNIEKDATVSSAFNSLVVGFSEVGQDTVRFLYEFGAFVKQGSTNDNVERSEFSCHVVDKEMADLAGAFAANAPSINLAMPFLDDEKLQESPITLHQLDCRSAAFYKKLEIWIKDNLNYAVICTENDELNISLAIRIFKLAIRYRNTMENFCVLVRIHNDGNEHFRRIAEHYNRLWASELQSTDKKKRTHQKKIRTTDHIQMPIYLFGLDEQTYTYENIISDKLEVNAKRYKAKYDASIDKLRRLSGNMAEDILTWENEHKDLMQLTEEYKGFSPTFSGIMRLRRIQSQNIANCKHLITKQKLALKALGEENYSVFEKHQLIRKENEITYVWKEYVKPKPEITRVLDVLAQTEHLRWNASHEILGYLDKGDENHKDEARLQHGCLKKWQELSPLIQSYDYNVVDVSLGIIDTAEKSN